MPKLLNPKFSICFIVLIFCTNFSVTAQETVLTARAVRAEATEKPNKEDEKGSVVRGRVTYRDSGAPVRRGWIGFRKIKDLIEKPKTENSGGFELVSPASSYTDEYVLTNDQGEFEMKNVKAGIYQPILKVQGVLNPGLGDRENPLFQQIAIDGVSEVQTAIGIVRGAAVSGRVSYADGSPVIGAKVQVMDKSKRTYSSYDYSNDNTTTTTDDLGYYRLSGLPEGDYFVRVVEPSMPANSGRTIKYYNLPSVNGSSQLRTYYPNADNQKEASPVQLFLGKDQTDINISIPDHRLFTMSGAVVAKADKKPIEKITVTFSKVDEDAIYEYSDGQNKQLKTDAAGIWRFEDLPKGKYRVQARINDEYIYEDGKSILKKPAVRYAPNAEIIDLEDKNAENILIELSPEATISGFVYDENGNAFLNRIYLSAVSRDFKNRAGGAAEYDSGNNANGKQRLTFKISALSEGEYYLTGSTADGFYIKSIKLGSKDLLNETVKVEAGDKIENIEIVLSDKIGTVKGKVSNLQKDDRAFIVMLPADRKGVFTLASAREAVVNDKGEFTVKAAPGDYYVLIGTAANRPNLEKFEEWLEEIKAKSEKVTVKLNETTEVSLTYRNE